MEKQIKVCHVNSYYSEAKLFGLLVKALIRIGVKNRVYCFLNKRSKIDVEIEDFVDIEYTYPYIYRFVFPLKHLKTYRCFKKYLSKQNNIEIIHAHSLFSNGYIAYRASKEFNIPYIVAVRNTDMNVFFKYMIFLRPMARKILINASKIIFISEPYKQLCISKYIKGENQKLSLLDKSEVVVNGINKKFIINRKNKSRLNDKINLIYVGEICRNKNLVTSINACKILINSGYKLRFTLVGEIKDDKLKALFDEDFIRYFPKQTQEDLIKFYGEGDIFIMPSKYETFGLVYAEAMTQGLPIIYTSGQGFDGQFEEGDVGFSVKYNDAQKIADSVIEIYKNYNEISQKACELSSRFDWDNIAKKYKKIYEEIVK